MSRTPGPTTTERDVLTVSRLVREVKSLLEGSFPLMWVEGEISNLSRPASGHLYFSLKDPHAQIRCALFRGHRRGLSVEPRDGMLVLARARVSLYEARGDFQLIVESLEDAGEGGLRRAFEELKQRLDKEGLFSTAHKKPLPRLPLRIGVITSPSGAVLHDILHTLARRFPSIPVLLYPVPVQGAGAAEVIASAIRLAGTRGDCDALILARGGGSLEDLWPFNEEIVARALYDCPLPVVSAVGHETDFTIADFVADARAPTPTAAAEMLSPNRDEWLDLLRRHERRLQLLVREKLRNRQQTVDHLAARLIRPDMRILALQQRLASMRMHLARAMESGLEGAGSRLKIGHTRLLARSPAQRVREQGMRLDHQRTRIIQYGRMAMNRAAERLNRCAEMLDTLSPLATLGRGYAIARLPDGRVVRSAADAKPGDPLNVHVARGVLECRVERLRDED